MIHPRFGGDLRKRAVTVVAEQQIRTKVGYINVQISVVVVIAGADPITPARGIDSRPSGDVFKFPVAEIVIKPVAMRYQLAAGRQLEGVDDVNVNQTVIIVVQQRYASAPGF